MNRADLEDTIVSVSTPIGEGGIAIVRMSGNKALEIADEIFVSKDANRPSRFKTYTVHYGQIINKRTTNYERRTTRDDVVDEVILTVMKAPKSYTREDVVEINCHGGVQAAKKILELAIQLGARMAEPGEFTKRAFLNGRLDLAQAEAVLDIVRARTESSLKVAVSQLEGELSKDLNAIRDEILDIASHVEASIDFPDEDIEIMAEASLIKKVEEVLSKLKRLIDTFDEGVVLREGILAVICGKPNVGKSSLMNLLLKRDRVIVTPIPGTTRDAVEEMISLRGVPIRLVDTAGIVDTQDLLEAESVKRSKKYLDLADLALLMLDYSTGIDNHDLEIMNLVGTKRKIVVINKIDLAKRMDDNVAEDLFKDDRLVKISVEEKKNVELLEKSILDIIWNGDFSQGESAIVTNSRHKELLGRAFQNMLSVDMALREKSQGPELIAIDLKEALFNLGLIVGKSVSDDILDRIFDEFCIGK